jgi:hypothetical protein
MSDYKRKIPPKCAPGGVPPCPTCPEQKHCAWAKRVLVTDARMLMLKMREGRQ